MNNNKNKEKLKKLDKFYTNSETVRIVLEYFKENFCDDIDIRKSLFIEPCAGGGAFLDGIKQVYKKDAHAAYDIEPDDLRIERADFFEINPVYSAKNIIVGNPPFGHRGNLAVDFINQSSKWADIIIFILPLQFIRFNIQKKINKNLKLIYSSDKFSENSFNFNSKPYDVNCLFQIWVSEEREEFKKYPNLRLLKPLPNKHEDFDLFIHNNTKGTLKYFDKAIYKWDFAVVRQGFYDYSKKILDPLELRENVQYLFVKHKSLVSEKIFGMIDFTELAESNTVIKGFSNTDVVSIYSKIKEEILNNG